jgi:predicted ATPase
MTETPAEDDGTVEPPVPFITRVRMKNYKSIAHCDVRLGPLTILIGPNGSGKSNFLDALAFLSRALVTTPAEALKERGGFHQIVRRVPEQQSSLSIALEVTFPVEPGSSVNAKGSYEIEITTGQQGDRQEFKISHERCALRLRGIEGYEVNNGVVREITDVDALFSDGLPPEEIAIDRLYLSIAAARRGLARSLFNALQNVIFYNFDLNVLREPQRQLKNPTLGSQGENLGDVIGAIGDEDSWHKERLDTYLQAIVPSASGIERWVSGSRVSVRLLARTGANGEIVEFGPDSMSDGTLRATAVLAALRQRNARSGIIPLLGIEEPEIALHPAAAGALFDALTEAATYVQVIATSQSSDLLDRDDLDISAVRPVLMEDGLTIIGEVDSASREIIEKDLSTLGELMRSNQLTPQPPNGGDQET